MMKKWQKCKKGSCDCIHFSFYTGTVLLNCGGIVLIGDKLFEIFSRIFFNISLYYNNIL